MENNPYDILGVKETDTIEYITKIYNDFMIILHPDKQNTQQARSLNMSPDERVMYFQMIRKAYQEIINSKKERNYPDFQMAYTVPEDSVIYTDRDLNKDDFNVNNFNKKFDVSRERDVKAGMSNPFQRGYDEFNSGRDFSRSDKVSIPVREDISVTKPTIFARNGELKDNRLVSYVPESASFTSGLNFQELGIVNISDFSVITNGKGKLEGNDLMNVYGNNYEYWEDTVKRDNSLYNRYNTGDSIEKVMESMKMQRKDIYNQPVDDNALRAELEHNNQMMLQERVRLSNQNKIDDYYNELNRGLLNGGVPPR
jgi:curved DNA-binding protein CbpA